MLTLPSCSLNMVFQLPASLLAKGRILIDGRDIGDYDANWLRRRMGFILQEPSLLFGSIAANIAMVSPEIDQEQLIEAAQSSRAIDFIEQKPNGFDYLISHGGLGLSGGEKQRVAFARALYCKPRILVMDEATSALDGISEKLVINSLRAEKRTVINIAHRLSAAVSSDLVVVLDRGIVIGAGSHDYLAHSHQLYRDLFNLDERISDQTLKEVV